MASWSDRVKNELATKIEKYRSLSDDALLEKDLKKQRSTNRNMAAAGSASACTIGTGGVSSVYHVGVATYHGCKLAKTATKSTVTRTLIEERNAERMKLGEPPLERRKPTFLQDVCDKTKGVVVDGGLGIKALDSVFSTSTSSQQNWSAPDWRANNERRYG